MGFADPKRFGPFDVGAIGAAGAWTWDPAAQRLYGDARFAMLYGLNPCDAAAGLPTNAFFGPIHPDDRMRIRIAVSGILHGAELFEKEYRILDAGGAVHWISAKGWGEHDASGALVRFSGVLADVTDQKRVQEQLRIAQTAGGVGTFEHVAGFATTTVSEQFCLLLGLHSADALPVRTINGCVHPDDEPLIRSASEAKPGACCSELRVRRADTGEERWIACRGEYRADGPAAGLRFVGVIYDITETKRAQGKLVELAEELEQRVEARTQERDRLWRTSRDLLLVVDLDGRYRAVNPAWTRLLGWREDELLGVTARDLVHPDDLEKLQATLQALARGQTVEGDQARLRAKDGTFRWIDWTIVPAKKQAYATGRDITERRQLEEQLRHSQKMEAVGQLTGGLAHDLNNMLTGVLGGMDLLRRRMASNRLADAHRFLEVAIASAERAAALTHRLLAFSRRQSLDTRPADVSRLVASMEDMLRRTLGEQIRLQVSAAPGAWLALTDESQLESAILNLSINARDAMPAGGELKIQIENTQVARTRITETETLEPGDYVVVSVSDTGTGMAKAVIDKAFDPFFTTKPVGQGTGLGLSMVYGFMRQTGGCVSIDSEEGRGACVKLYLPRATSPAAKPAPGDRPRATPRGDGETVLVVEDDPSVRILVRDVLDELGYAAIEATDADAALKAIAAAPKIDLLVTDVGLPGVNGRQLAEMVRERHPDLPVLFMTGYAPNASVRADFLAPGMDMVSKPFAVDTLAQRIRSMVEG